MNRRELEHTIRAAGSIANDHELYVVGSQSILGAFPDAHGDLCRSMEVDIAPKNVPELEQLIEGSIGELSPFHVTFGYYVDGIDITCITLPSDWRARVIEVKNSNTNGYAGLCLDPTDLAVSKLAAGREKDIDFVRIMFREKLVASAVVKARLRLVDSLAADIGRLDLLVDRLNAEGVAAATAK